MKLDEIITLKRWIQMEERALFLISVFYDDKLGEYRSGETGLQMNYPHLRKLRYRWWMDYSKANSKVNNRARNI